MRNVLITDSRTGKVTGRRGFGVGGDGRVKLDKGQNEAI